MPPSTLYTPCGFNLLIERTILVFEATGKGALPRTSKLHPSRLRSILEFYSLLLVRHSTPPGLMFASVACSVLDSLAILYPLVPKRFPRRRFNAYQVRATIVALSLLSTGCVSRAEMNTLN